MKRKKSIDKTREKKDKIDIKHKKTEKYKKTGKT